MVKHLTTYPEIKGLNADIFQVWMTEIKVIILDEVPYFIEYIAHFFILKMMLKYSLHTIHGR